MESMYKPDIDGVKFINTLIRELEDLNVEDRLQVLGYMCYLIHFRKCAKDKTK